MKVRIGFFRTKFNEKAPLEYDSEPVDSRAGFSNLDDLLVMTIKLHGETLSMRPDGSLYWHEQETLFVADLHLGKAATFRSSGIPVPEGDTEHDLLRLGDALEREPTRRLVILGDLIHARTGRTRIVMATFERWLNTVASRVEIALVTGNHDRQSGALDRDWPIRELGKSHREGPFTFEHFPRQPNEGCVLCGHTHPTIRIVSRRNERLHGRCFFLQPGCLTLPSFGAFTGGGRVHPAPEDRVFLIAENRVIEVPSVLCSA